MAALLHLAHHVQAERHRRQVVRHHRIAHMAVDLAEEDSPVDLAEESPPHIVLLVSITIIWLVTALVA